MIVMTEIIGHYSQTLKICQWGGDNMVTIKRGSETLYDGIAKRIEDKGNTIKFTDVDGKEHEYVKYETYTWA